jgi:hypothetical protein
VGCGEDESKSLEKKSKKKKGKKGKQGKKYVINTIECKGHLELMRIIIERNGWKVFCSFLKISFPFYFMMSLIYGLN